MEMEWNALRTMGSRGGGESLLVEETERGTPDREIMEGNKGRQKQEIYIKMQVTCTGSSATSFKIQNRNLKCGVLMVNVKEKWRTVYKIVNTYPNAK